MTSAQTSVSSELIKLKCSDRGRPTKNKHIVFTPQPKSIVSQLLISKIKNDKKKLYEHINLNIDEISDSDRHESLNNNRNIEQELKNDKIAPSHKNKIAQNSDETSNNIKFHTILNKKVEDNHASSQPSNLINCQICSTGSSSSFQHKEHLKTHKKGDKFCCDYPDCTYLSKLSSNLIKHKRSHTSDKPYLCDKCSFRTNFINSLKVHKRLHTSEKPFQCEQCEYKCNSSSNLKKHCWHRHIRHKIN